MLSEEECVTVKKEGVPVTEVKGSASFTVKVEPLEQTILPLLDYANRHNDVTAALELVKVEAIIQEQNKLRELEPCVDCKVETAETDPISSNSSAHRVSEMEDVRVDSDTVFRRPKRVRKAVNYYQGHLESTVVEHSESCEKMPLDSDSLEAMVLGQEETCDDFKIESAKVEDVKPCLECEMESSAEVIPSSSPEEDISVQSSLQPEQFEQLSVSITTLMITNNYIGPQSSKILYVSEFKTARPICGNGQSRKRYMGEKYLACDKCSYRTAHRGRLQSHRELHFAPWYTCFCGFSCRTKNALKRHWTNVHTARRPFPCNECDYSSNFASGLRVHMTVHRIQEEPLKCTECPFSAVTRFQLKNHRQIHRADLNTSTMKSSVEDYNSQDEDISIPSALQNEEFEQLTVPIPTPTITKSYNDVGPLMPAGSLLPTVSEVKQVRRKCEKGQSRKKSAELNKCFCGFRCRTKKCLKEHWKTAHTDHYPPYSYRLRKVCVTTELKDGLKSHISRCHSTEGTTFKCTVTECSYSSAKHLKRHQLVHTQEKPFACSQCEYRTNYKHTLKTHMMQHTGERRFKCDVPDCTYTAVFKNNFQNHVKSKHS